MDKTPEIYVFTRQPNAIYHNNYVLSVIGETWLL